MLPNIYVCERGFVLVARPRPAERGDDFMFITLDDCCIVRIWGTQHGLGQLAREGPLAETVLDYEGDGERLAKTCIYREIPCGPAWESWKPTVPAARATGRRGR